MKTFWVAMHADGRMLEGTFSSWRKYSVELRDKFSFRDKEHEREWPIVKVEIRRIAKKRRARSASGSAERKETE